ncbi:hypothetical protein KY343_06335 [Candidatus Woesearchaeota archaeon]|nr:hypothetical protein [Candidatus Woesearchaeota archaeon]
MLEYVINVLLGRKEIPELDKAMKDLKRRKDEIYSEREKLKGKDAPLLGVFYLSFGFSLIDHSEKLLPCVHSAENFKERLDDFWLLKRYRLKRKIDEVEDARIKTDRMIREYLEEFDKFKFHDDPKLRRWLGREFYDIYEPDGRIYTVDYKNLTDSKFVKSALETYRRLIFEYSNPVLRKIAKGF